MRTKTDLPIAIPKNTGIEQIEATMLNMEQAECPVSHFFGPGVYIRQVNLPAGTIALGHHQKYPHTNIMLKGKVAMVNGDELTIVQAPLMFTGEPGRKMGYVIEECVWLNVYSTTETDIDKLENEFFVKSDTWEEFQSGMKEFKFVCREGDRKDFDLLVSSLGISEQKIREMSENEDDQIKLIEPWSSAVSVRDSDIEGKGLFLSWPVEENTIIAPARLMGRRTEAGRYVNHAKNPNCKYVMFSNGDIFLVATRNISGCKGGGKGEELTVDYRQALSLSGIEVSKCLE